MIDVRYKMRPDGCMGVFGVTDLASKDEELELLASVLRHMSRISKADVIALMNDYDDIVNPCRNCICDSCARRSKCIDCNCYVCVIDDPEGGHANYMADNCFKYVRE